MAKQRTEVADIDRSLYDFKDSEEGFERLDAGLTPEIVTEISRRMHIRKAPRFVFCADDGAAYAAHINELLAGLEKDDPARGE